MILTRKNQKYAEKTDPSRAVLGSSPVLRSEKRATNFLSHGTT